MSTRRTNVMFHGFAADIGIACALLMGAAPAAWPAQEPAETPGTFAYNPAGHRDPFVPLVRDGRLVGVAPGGARGAASKPVLYGILWDPGGQSIALINDAEVKVGDAVGGYRVKEIRQDAVVLINGGVPVVLEIAFEAPPSTLSPGATTGGEGR